MPRAIEFTGEDIVKIVVMSFVANLAVERHGPKNTSEVAALVVLGLVCSALLSFTLSRSNQPLPEQRAPEGGLFVQRARLTRDLSKYAVSLGSLGMALLIMNKGRSAELSENERWLILFNLAAARIAATIDADAIFGTGDADDARHGLRRAA